MLWRNYLKFQHMWQIRWMNLMMKVLKIVYTTAQKNDIRLKHLSVNSADISEYEKENIYENTNF